MLSPLPTMTRRPSQLNVYLYTASLAAVNNSSKWRRSIIHINTISTNIVKIIIIIIRRYDLFLQLHHNIIKLYASSEHFHRIVHINLYSSIPSVVT